MPVGEMLARMSSRELSEWLAFASLEPFGEERADARSAIVAATVANRLRGKNERAHKPEEFMPFREKAAPSVDDLAAKFRALTGKSR